MPGTGPEHRRPAWETEREKGEESEPSAECGVGVRCGMLTSSNLLAANPASSPGLVTVGEPEDAIRFLRAK
ncbi:hypothetical protein B296_00018373 [Ensete ventricosum]|uniref:Uncharacterized protein n=1 Tax=Ensete ventricosum TaxID=4639 RepID=A0A427B3X5_ENSVE|nr:hypothetical protein B296_00018373 [Ensete ventricosum]